MIKLFAHRGYHTKSIPQNSLRSIKNAFKNGFRAVEFDIWLFKNELLINHDKPNLKTLNKLNRFSEFMIYGNDIEYWLDFKNMNLKSVKKILTLLKKDIDKANIKYEKLYFAPYITRYSNLKKIFDCITSIFSEKIKLVMVCDNSKQIKELIKFSNSNKINFLSIDYKLLNQKNIDLLKKLQILAWTVNDINKIKELSKLGVKYFATDTVIPSKIKLIQF